MRLTFSGGATAEQEQDIMSGETLTANLNAQKKLQKLEMRGNSYLRSMTEGHAAEARAIDIDFYLDANQQLQRAYAVRDIRAQTLNADSDVQLTGANILDINFQAQGDRSVIKEMKSRGTLSRKSVGAENASKRSARREQAFDCGLDQVDLAIERQRPGKGRSGWQCRAVRRAGAENRDRRREDSDGDSVRL